VHWQQSLIYICALFFGFWRICTKIPSKQKDPGLRDIVDIVGKDINAIESRQKREIFQKQKSPGNKP
jgi:hypothetical protein